MYIQLLLLIVACSCSRGESFRRCEGVAWGTTYHIIYKSAVNLSDSITAEMRRVEHSLSMFAPESTVSRLNSGSTDSVDAYIEAVWRICGRVNHLSGGMFDPTVAPLTDLWGFGRAGREVAVPDSGKVAATLERVGFRRCRLKDGRLERPEGCELDFSAVAKGFGVDCVAAMLSRNGCSDYMVEIGGEVSVSGLNPDGRKWRIQIDAPVDGLPGENAMGVMDLTNCALATSGNYRNKRRVAADSVVGHTIDPHTGYPVQRSVVSATVVAPTCGLADALATACMLCDTATSRRMLSALPSCSALLGLHDSTLVTLP